MIKVYLIFISGVDISPPTFSSLFIFLVWRYKYSATLRKSQSETKSSTMKIDMEKVREGFKHQARMQILTFA